ncbi:hypothetical protein, partial [Roseinatronobacter thiooxidans]|uniref:hypothetical protein n=1 Tax=Roseinatronobacter thiooxidans TaxID=121821 RepID=UPI001C435733
MGGSAFSVAMTARSACWASRLRLCHRDLLRDVSNFNLTTAVFVPVLLQISAACDTACAKKPFRA